MSQYIPWDQRKSVEFSSIVGVTMVSVVVNESRDDIEFTTSDGRKFLMHHDQDCCESVDIEDICGELSDLVGSPITMAEESSSDQTPVGFTHEYEPESQTWTFYKLATIKGYVDIRWFGESNGYYSESVDFIEIISTGSAA